MIIGARIQEISSQDKDLKRHMRMSMIEMVSNYELQQLGTDKKKMNYNRFDNDIRNGRGTDGKRKNPNAVFE